MLGKKILVAVKEGEDIGDRQTWKRNTGTAREGDRDKRIVLQNVELQNVELQNVEKQNVELQKVKLQTSNDKGLNEHTVECYSTIGTVEEQNVE